MPVVTNLNPVLANNNSVLYNSSKLMVILSWSRKMHNNTHKDLPTAVARQNDARWETQNWHPPPFIKKYLF